MREKMKNNWRENRLKSSVPLCVLHFVFIGTGKSACNLATNSLNRGRSGNAVSVNRSQRKQVLSQVAESIGGDDAFGSRYFIIPAFCFFHPKQNNRKINK